MAGSELHPSVAFATRYGAPTDQYFNAHSALIRAEELREDAKRLSEAFDKTYPEDERWAPWWGADVVSYYAVGAVTCLEWHARSRTTDIFTYKPKAIDANDIKGRLSEKLLPQMISQNATVAQLLGGSLTVNSFVNYAGAFNRIFKELGILGDIYAWLKKPIDGTMTFEGEHFETIDELYRFRHMLVHEIGIHVLGHNNVREDWDTERAVANCDLVHSLIKKIERVIYAHAPKDFPNLVDAEGSPLLTTDYLTSEIKILESRLKRIMDNFLSQNSVTDVTDSPLTENFRLAACSIQAEIEFINTTPLLRSRYVNLQEPALLILLRNRVSYLKGIIELAASHWEIDESEQSEEASEQSG